MTSFAETYFQNIFVQNGHIYNRIRAKFASIGSFSVFVQCQYHVDDFYVRHKSLLEYSATECLSKLCSFRSVDERSAQKFSAPFDMRDLRNGQIQDGVPVRVF
jgi:hypothetical protein